MATLDPKRRREYMKLAGLTPTMIKQTVGTITLDPMSVQASGLSAEVAQEALTAIETSTEDCTTISAMYNTVGQTSLQDPRDVVERANLLADTAILDQLFADEYQLTDSAGNVGDKQKTIDAILSGKIQKKTFGRGGFESSDGVLQVHGTTSILSGEFKMNATQLARNTKTGEIKRQPRNGTFRSTHTYIFRDDRWQLAASQLTETTKSTLPPGWVFIND